LLRINHALPDIWLVTFKLLKLFQDALYPLDILQSLGTLLLKLLSQSLFICPPLGFARLIFVPTAKKLVVRIK